MHLVRWVCEQNMRYLHECKAREPGTATVVSEDMYKAENLKKQTAKTATLSKLRSKIKYS